MSQESTNSIDTPKPDLIDASNSIFNLIQNFNLILKKGTIFSVLLEFKFFFMII